MLNNQTIAQTIHVSGKINDIETNKPIANVHIKIAGKPIGTISNTLGRFAIEINRIPCTLIISHISYETKYVKIDAKKLKSISILLTKKTNFLKEVKITDKKVFELLKNTKYFVYDFTIFENSLLLVAFDGKKLAKAKLVLLNLDGNIITTKNIIKPEKLYKDCLGTCHLISKDTAYQIFFDNKNIQLLYPVCINKFKELMYPCIAELNNKLYFKKYYYNDQVLLYYYIDETTKEDKEICYISDEVGINILKNIDRHIKMTGYKYDENDAIFDKMCFFNPIHAPLIKTDSAIVIFNYIKSKIEFYSKNGSFYKEVSINYHKNSTWKEQLFIDSYTNDIYTLFENYNGINTLAKIDINIGEIVAKYKIPHFTYIYKIMIYKNNVYFLYSDRKRTELRKLYKMFLLN